MPKPIQAPEQFQDVIFPARGLDVSVEREEQPPLTSVLGLNVRNFEPITFRGRGGIRSGLNKYINGKVNGTALIQHIQIIVDPQASALGDSFVDGVAGWDILIPDSITPYILADGSYDTTGPNGSGYHTNKKKKRKHPQLIIKAKNQTKTQGDEFTWNGSEYTITHGSLLSGDTIKSVSFRSDGADKDAANGNYDIIASNAVFQLSNAPGYEVIYQKGTMKVKSSIEFIDAKAQGFASSSPNDVSVMTAVEVDDLLVVFWAADFGSTSSVTDNLGNTYTKAGTAGTDGSLRMECWYCISQSAGSLTVTVASGGAFIGIAALIYSGLNATPLDDYQPSTSDATSDFINVHTRSVNVTTANSNLIIGCFAQDFDAETFNPGGSALLRANENDGSSYMAIYVEDVIDAPSAAAMTGTLSGGLGALNGVVAIGISFKP